MVIRRGRFYCVWPNCVASFGRKGDLKRHENIHTNDRKYKCPYCPKEFTQNSGLKTHMNIHTGAKPYKCKFCDKEFGDPSSHTRHRRETHLVNYRYKCPVEGCTSAIKRRTAFVDHLQRKHDVVATAKQIDGMKRHFEKTPVARNKTQRTKKSLVIKAEDGSSPQIDILDGLHKIEESVYTSLSSDHTGQRINEEQYPSSSYSSQQPDDQSSFWSQTGETSSTSSSQSSYELDDFNFDAYTDDKLIYTDVYDDISNMSSIEDFTSSSSSSPMPSPFVRAGYRPPAYMNPRELFRMNTRMTHDRAHYGSSGASGQISCNPNLYAAPQDHDQHLSQYHSPTSFQQQHHTRQWQQPWGFA